MYRRGKLRLQIVSLQPGSLVVTLLVTLQDPEFPVGVSTLRPLLQRLAVSTVFRVDQQGTLVQGRISVNCSRVGSAPLALVVIHFALMQGKPKRANFHTAC